MSQKDSDIKKIKILIDIMKENDLTELEVSHDNDKILLKRGSPHAPVYNAMPFFGQNIASPAVAGGGETAEVDDGLVEITSPIVGTFYSQQSPDAGVYVEPGSHVEPDSVVCIVEAMKVMNEIKAEMSGTIVEVLPSNGQAVEFGQALFKVRPD